MLAYNRVLTAFTNRFSSQPLLFASPGRINLLGEHTDHNEGFVLPAAIDKEVHFAIAFNNSQTYNFVSLDLDQTFSTETIAPSDSGWANYLLGSMAQLVKRGIEIPGFDLVFGGDIPIGAGISSSAAIECGMLFALNTLLNCGFSTVQMAQMAQKAEHEYAGVNCGIMDQFAVLHGERDQVIKLDCRSLQYSLHPLKLNGYRFILCDSLVTHALASSGYNTRRAECEEAVRALSSQFPVQALRDATPQQIDALATQMSPEALKRARYVVAENARVLQACEALEAGDLVQLGHLMFATHDGMQYGFEASCAEVDQLVDIARQCQGVLGARIMGGGFGGCSINLVADEQLEAFQAAVIRDYYTPRRLHPTFIVTQINDGTHQVSL